MKYLLIFSTFCIFACGDPADKEYVLPERPLSQDSIPTIEIGASVEELSEITVQLPKLTDKRCPTAVFNIEVHIADDTVSNYSIKYVCGGAAKTTPKAHYIQPNDTKIKIARRLGLQPHQILNREPLKVGEKINAKAN